MELQLKNIGMIKEANVKIDGLSVIAGENDTGKSTVGKILMSLIHADKIRNGNYGNFFENRNNFFIQITNNLFQNQLMRDNQIEFNINLIDNNKNTIYSVANKNGNIRYIHTSIDYYEKPPFLDCIFIQSPIIFNLFDFFSSINFAKTQSELFNQNTLQIAYPYISWDLFGKLMTPRQFIFSNVQIIENIQNIINGNFKRDSFGRYYFSRLINKQERIYNLQVTSEGIKYFGILQALLNNAYLYSNDFLILDEPEVHLHPNWQLEMVKIIIELVKNGVKILVTSHSPYMIEALKRYSELEEDIEDKTNFYLAENGYIEQIDNSNSQTLVAIYEKLSEPYDIFEKMESDRFNNG